MHGAGGTILHVCIDGGTSIPVHCRTAHHMAWPIRCRTRLTSIQTSLNLLGESNPTRSAIAWAFTQYDAHGDYVLTFRQQVVRLSGRRIRPLNDNAAEQSTHPVVDTMNMTLRISLALLFSISCILLVVGYLGGFSSPDLIPRTLSLSSKPSSEPSPTSAGLTINLPAIVAPVDDGTQFYYIQANLAVEIDRAATGTLIRERHDQIDRYIMEMLHAYPVQDLRAPGQSVTLREDLKRTVNRLLPKGQVRNVYITNWLMTPVGS